MKINRGIRRGSLLLIAVFSLFLACNKSSDFGSDLLSDDFLQVRFDDTLRLTGRNVLADSVRTFDLLTAATDSILILGNMEDPYFGRVKSEIFFNVRPTRTLVGLDRDSLELDSLVLRLGVDAATVYGDTLKPANIRVFRLAEQLPADSSFYSNSNRLAELNPLGTLDDYLFTPRTPIQHIDSSAGKPDTLYSHSYFTVRLADALGQEMLDDPTVFDSLPKLQQLLRGFKVTIDNPSLLAGINLLSARTRLALHYKYNGQARILDMYVTADIRRFSRFEQDPAGAPLADFLDNPEAADSLLFLQGLAGSRVRLIVPDLAPYADKGIKLAQLELTVAQLPDNANTRYPVPAQLLVSEVREDGTISLLQEINVLLPAGRMAQFGGTPRTVYADGTHLTTYRVSLTEHVIRMLNDKATPEIVVSILSTARRANRVVLCGPGHPQYPVRLKLAYTEY